MAFAAVSVDNSATLILAQNAQRQSVVLTNESTTVTVFLASTNSITASNAPSLRPGGTFTEDNSGGRMYKGDIYGRTSSGTADVRVWERLQSL